MRHTTRDTKRYPQYSVPASHGSLWKGSRRGAHHQLHGACQSDRAAIVAYILGKSFLRAIDIAGTQCAFELALARYSSLHKDGPDLPEPQYLEKQVPQRLGACINQMPHRDTRGCDWASRIQEDIGDDGRQTRSKTRVDDLLL